MDFAALAPSILFVCFGNICRSPAGEGILKSLANKKKLDLHVESCGLGNWHKGQLPDLRMRQVAEERGYHLDSRAYAFEPKFFDTFDFIFAADRSVYKALAAKGPTDKLRLICDFSEKYPGHEIPDPYHGELEDFRIALTMLEDACHGFLKSLG